MRAWCVAFLLAGCVHSNSKECPDRLCPEGNVCDTTHNLCVTQAQDDACTSTNEGEQCTTGDFVGVCNQGYCIAGCGNSIVEDLSTLQLGVAEQCDDGNFASHDGCSSRCTVEIPVWTEWHSPWLPRLGHAAAFDSQRGKLVVFGGFVASGVTDQHWERTRSAGGVYDTWTQPALATRPPARAQAAMAYDSTRHRIVLFGGAAANSVLNDQWEFDGTAWTQINATNPPGGRTTAAMAYDPVRQRIVMVGGFTAAGPTNETWEYDGTTNTWSQAALPTSAPLFSPRAYTQLAWDPVRQKIVLFGGLNILSETWTFDGAWTQLSTQGPLGRYGAQLAYSSSRNAIVMFGGVVPSPALGFVSDTWELGSASSTWSAVPNGSVIPPARGFGVLAPTETGSIVLVAGRDENALDDIWEYAGAWQPRGVTFSPSPRVGSQLSYDSKTKRTYVFGGVNGPLLHDTWAFDSNGWTLEDGGATAGLQRYSQAQAYDPVHDRLMIVGGAVPSGQQTGTTFAFDPSTKTWTLGVDVPARRAGALVFDPDAGKLVLFGGSVGTSLGSATATDTTSEFDGTAWTDVPGAGPPAYGTPAMAYDPTHHRLVVFANGETWQRVAGAWSKLDVATSPPARSNAQMVFHPERGRIWLYGGEVGNAIYTDLWELAPDDSTWLPIVVPGSGPRPRGGPQLVARERGRGLLLFGGSAIDSVVGDTWELRYQSLVPDEDCKNGIDDDGDAHVDVTDPDCTP